MAFNLSRAGPKCNTPISDKYKTKILTAKKRIFLYEIKFIFGFN